MLFRGFTLVACASVVLAAAAFAQPPRRPGGGPGGGGRDPFFEVLREVHHESLNKEIFDLLHHEEVRKEVGLAEEDAKAVHGHIRQAMHAIIELREQYRGQESLAEEEVKQAIRDAVAPHDAAAYEILKSKTDFRRLLGLYVQARNHRAALNEHVAAEIGMDSAELDEFRKESARAWRSIMEGVRDDIAQQIRQQNSTGDDPRQVIGRLMHGAEQRLDTTLGWKLEAEQRRRLKELKGEPFPLPSNPFFFPHRGPPRGEGRGDEGRGDDAGRRDGRRGPPRGDDRHDTDQGDPGHRSDAAGD